MQAGVTSSAPGSLMLFGEHAVLRGRAAMVAAVDRRLRVRLVPRADDRVVVTSALGRHETTLAVLDPHPDFRFLLAALRRFRPRLSRGLDIDVASEFSHRIGFGSSAAVSVAALGALRILLGDSTTPDDLLADAVEVIRGVQGCGSGADAAASVLGGFVAYRAEPRTALRLRGAHPLTAVYSGAKTPTPDVLTFVERRRQQCPPVYDALDDAIGRCAEAAAEAADRGDWPAVGALMHVGQGLLDALGVNNEALARIVAALRADPGILGAKISGSGLGDCAVGLGRVTGTDFPFEILPVMPAMEGWRLE